VLKIGPKRGAFCGTNSVCILLAAIGSAVWLDNSAEGSHCCIPASALKSAVLLTAACSSANGCWISVATVVTWTGHGDRLHVCDCLSSVDSARVMKVFLPWRGDGQWISRWMLITLRTCVWKVFGSKPIPNAYSMSVPEEYLGVGNASSHPPFLRYLTW